jgi:hypothetical protein
MVFLVSGKISFEPRQCIAPSTLSILLARNQITICINNTYQLSSHLNQCCGSGSGRIRNCEQDQDPDPDPEKINQDPAAPDPK